jgi:hypothetical protein
MHTGDKKKGNQHMTSVDVVQRQFDAYNARDLPGFLATYSESAQIYYLPATEPALSGKAQLAQYYGTQRFNRPDLHAELVNRIILGNKVIDQERVRGIADTPIEGIAVYEVREGVIQVVWFFSPE